MKIVVLGGGISTERHVSLVTATSVCKALRSIGHKAIFVDMFLGLENLQGNLDELFEREDGLCGEVAIEHTEPDIGAVIASRADKSNSRLGKNVLEVCRRADCVFLGLHGLDGEDGKIQATLDLLGIPYTGSDHLSSAMALDKAVAKKIMLSAGIPTPAGREVCLDETVDEEVINDQKLPCVVKAVNGGSSIGVYMCDTEAELVSALKEVKKYSSRVLVEEKICGREFTVPVLDDRALDVIEIVPPEGNSFDYVAKYQSGDEGAREICPAVIPEELAGRLQALALQFHKALGLSVYSRTDFIVDRDGNPWCLEVNTLPGMTPNSLIPKAAKRAGYDYPQLCEKIIEISIKK